jgi:DNA-binding transcriptional LysR family regulator
MDLRDIEYFGVIADHRNLGRASEALGLTTPALSKSLRRLESALNAKLVRRTSKGIELTPEGRALIPHVKRLRLSFADLTREVSCIRDGNAGHLRVATTPGNLEDVVGAACGEFLNDARGATVALGVIAQDDVMGALLEGKFDLAVGVISAATPDLVHHHFSDDVFVVHAAARHRLAGRAQVELEEVARERWIRTAATGYAGHAFNKVFEDRGIKPPEIALECVSLTARLHAVSKSDLLYFAPRAIAVLAAPRFKLVELPVKELTYARHNVVSHRSDAYLPPAADKFIAALKSTAQMLAEDRKSKQADPVGADGAPPIVRGR